MSGGAEALGDIATGALVSRAVEPGHGEAGHGAPASDICPNCGAKMIGPYCHVCGQNGHVHRTLHSFLHDLLHGVFHFDGKFWNTLPMLIARPGALTRRYIAVERAKFISPLAMFLFSIFVMFAVFGSVGGPQISSSATRNGVQLTPESIKAELAGDQRQLAQLREQRAALRAKQGDTAATDKKIDDLQDDISGLQIAQRAIGMTSSGLMLTLITNLKTGNHWIDEHLAAGQKDPKLLAYKLKMNAYKYSWLIIPLSLPFVALLFAWMPAFNLYDHVVFITYSLCAMTLMFTLSVLLSAIGMSVGWILFLVPVHFFLQLRGAYQLGAWSAIWRTVALVIIASCILVLFVFLALLLGVMH